MAIQPLEQGYAEGGAPVCRMTIQELPRVQWLVCLLVLQPFALPCFHRASSLLWPLLTSVRTPVHADLPG